jgi:hypothetical protein
MRSLLVLQLHVIVTCHHVGRGLPRRILHDKNT